MSATPSPAGPRGFYILYWLRTLLLVWAIVQAVWLGLAAWTMAMRGTLADSFSGPRLDPPLLADFSDVTLAAMHAVGVLHGLLPAVCLVVLSLAVSRLWQGRLDLTTHAESGIFASVIGALIVVFGLMGVALFLASRVLDQQARISLFLAWGWILSARPVLFLAAGAGMVEMWRRAADQQDAASLSAALRGRNADLWRIVALVGGGGLLLFALCSLVFDAAVLYAQLQVPGDNLMGPRRLPPDAPLLTSVRQVIGPLSLLTGFVAFASLGAWVIGRRRRLAAITQQTLHGSTAARAMAFVLMLAAPCAITAAIFDAIASMHGELRSSPGAILLMAGVWGLQACKSIMLAAAGALLLRFARLTRATAPLPPMIAPARPTV